ncbi:unnamed protein product [Adineta ricciae]|uniref:Uncharacterized protein n=1 Tax=Adineta ricciae TaxID=249248 RepID=A0A815TLU6_ADIRI|nr:unnamed protein product [Adineta ricciae]
MANLCQLLICLPMLKYLQIQALFNYPDKLYRLNFRSTEVRHLKQFILGVCELSMRDMQTLFKHLRYLEIVSLSTSLTRRYVDSKLWQCSIKSLLAHLRTFIFSFSLIVPMLTMSLLYKLRNRRLPNVSSLTIGPKLLIPYLDNKQLSECLKKKVPMLYILGIHYIEQLRSGEISLLYLLSILREWVNLLAVKLGSTDEETFSYGSETMHQH